jgi:hypothetical protein
MRVLMAISFLLGGCMVPVPIPGFSKPYSQTQAERVAANSIEPRTLILPEGNPPPVAAMRVRAWVDTDFRAGPRWRAHVEDWVARASAYAEAAFGVRFELDIRSWNHGGDDTLATTLELLEREDPGDEVDLVVAFVRASSGATNDYHRLGMARPLGKHFVLRDMNDADEARALESGFSRLRESERAALYTARKKHKELLGFLHEWAHVMGLPHEPENGRVMSTGYSHLASTFSAAGAKLIRLSVRSRRGEPVTAEMRQLLASNGDWPASERNDVLQGLGGGPLVASAPAAAMVSTPSIEDELRDDLHAGALTRAEELLPKVSDPTLGAHVKDEILRQRRETGLPRDRAASGVAAEDETTVREAFVSAMKELGAGNVPAARKMIAATAKQFPRALPVLVLTCCLWGFADNAPKARKACAAALGRWDEIPFAHFWMGQVAADAKERIAHHRRVLELDPTVEGSWQALAQLYEKQGNLAAVNELRSAYLVQFHQSMPR